MRRSSISGPLRLAIAIRIDPAVESLSLAKTFTGSVLSILGTDPRSSKPSTKIVTYEIGRHLTEKLS